MCFSLNFLFQFHLCIILNSGMGDLGIGGLGISIGTPHHHDHNKKLSFSHNEDIDDYGTLTQGSWTCMWQREVSTQNVSSLLFLILEPATRPCWTTQGGFFVFAFFFVFVFAFALSLSLSLSLPCLCLCICICPACCSCYWNQKPGSAGRDPSCFENVRLIIEKLEFRQKSSLIMT